MDELLDLIEAHPNLTLYGSAAVLAFLPAAIAYRKGRSFVGWWIYGFLLLIVALPVALFMGRNVEALEKRRMRHEGLKRCGSCGELIRQEARVCRFCQKEVTAPV